VGTYLHRQRKTFTFGFDKTFFNNYYLLDNLHLSNFKSPFLGDACKKGDICGMFIRKKKNRLTG